MTSLIRRLFCAYVLIFVATGLSAGPALSEETNGSGAAVRLAMMTTPAPLNTEAVVPPLAEPAALLCGKVWVETKYVLPNNCLKACLNTGHKLGDCITTLVPLCQSCWKHLVACSTSQWIPPVERCKICTWNYAACMKSFF